MDVPLKPLRSITMTKTFENTSLMFQIDGSEEKRTTVIGFGIFNANGSELICQRDVDYGLTLNKAELYAIL